MNSCTHIFISLFYTLWQGPYCFPEHSHHVTDIMHQTWQPAAAPLALPSSFLLVRCKHWHTFKIAKNKKYVAQWLTDTPFPTSLASGSKNFLNCQIPAVSLSTAFPITGSSRGEAPLMAPVLYGLQALLMSCFFSSVWCVWAQLGRVVITVRIWLH